MHVAQEFPEGDVVLQVENVTESLRLGGVVVEHQQDAGEAQHQKKVEGDAAHAPGVVVADGVAVDLSRVEVEENVGQHTERAVAGLVVVLDAEDGAEELGFLRFLQRRGFFLDFFLQGASAFFGFAQNSAQAFLGGLRLVFVGHPTPPQLGVFRCPTRSERRSNHQIHRAPLLVFHRVRWCPP